MKHLLYLPTRFGRLLFSATILLATTLFGEAQAATITVRPVSQSVVVGSNATFSVTATGSAPLTYQWRFNGSNLTDGGRIAGASSSSLTISNVQYADVGIYDARVYESGIGLSSGQAQLWVHNGMPIGEALDATNLVWQTSNGWTWGNSNTHDGVDSAEILATSWVSPYLETSVEGPTSVNFWWQTSLYTYDYLTLRLDGNEITRISGTTPWESRSIFIPSGSHTVRWVYSRVVSGEDFSKRAYVDEVTVTAPTLPVVVNGPTNQTVPAGTNITLTGSATGMLPISYQWQFNGTNLSGATGTSLALTDLEAQHSGIYSLVASNGAGTISSSADITVVPAAPFITQQPQSQTVYYGVSTSFSVEATGTEPASFGYQWQFNGTNLVEATNVTLTLTNPQYTNAGSYRVIVSNIVGTTVSSPATLTVLDRAPIILSNSSKSVPLGNRTNLSVSVTAFSPSYQWRFNGTNLVDGAFVSGATTATLTFTNARARHAGIYSVIVSNPYGWASSKCELKVLDTVAWGAGSTTNISEPNYGQSIIPADLTNAVAFAGGRYHSLALKRDGTVVAWGANTNSTQSQVFFGQTIVPSGLSNVTAIAGGGYHSLALKNDGTVVAWGAGTNPQESEGVHYGQSIVPGNLFGVKAIAAGYLHSMALRSDGTVVSWGLQTNVPAGLSNVTAIAAGRDHNAALLANGRVVAWGSNNDFSQTNVPATLSNVIAIAAGDYHSIALKNDGQIVTWGKPVGSPPSNFGDEFVEIAAGGDHNIAVRTNGAVSAWGFNQNGLSPIPSVFSAINVAAGYQHNLVLLKETPPVIKASPGNRDAVFGENVTLNVLALVGPPPRSYQWQHNGTNVPGATKASINFPSVQPINAGAYVLVLTNFYGSVTSAPALLSVPTPVATTNLGLALDATSLIWSTTGNAPWFGQTNNIHGGTTAAQSGLITDSQQSRLMTTVTGPGKLTFWWRVSSEQYFDTLNFYIGGNLQTNISGSTFWTQQTFQVPPGIQTLEWRYVKDFNTTAGNDAGWVDQVLFIPPPTILKQPTNQWAQYGGSAQLSVEVSGIGPFSYQWNKGGIPKAGATDSSLVLPFVTRADTGSYSVTIHNAGGDVVSSNATLTVLVPQRITGAATLADGSFQLRSGYYDNVPLQGSDLPRFEALVSSNLVEWVTLSNSISITNGRLLLQDAEATNWPMRFYRVVEH